MICASINEEIVHGIPAPERVLNDGDIFSVDIGLELNGFFADKAETVLVGTASSEGRELLEVARESLRLGLEQAAPGNRLSDISHVIGVYAESQGYALVKRFVGHGIGRADA